MGEGGKAELPCARQGWCSCAESASVPDKTLSPSRFSRSVADTVVEELATSSIRKKKTNASESGDLERSRLSLSVLQI